MNLIRRLNSENFYLLSHSLKFGVLLRGGGSGWQHMQNFRTKTANLHQLGQKSRDMGVNTTMVKRSELSDLLP